MAVGDRNSLRAIQVNRHHLVYPLRASSRRGCSHCKEIVAGRRMVPSTIEPESDLPSFPVLTPPYLLQAKVFKLLTLKRLQEKPLRRLDRCRDLVRLVSSGLAHNGSLLSNGPSADAQRASKLTP